MKEPLRVCTKSGCRNLVRGGGRCEQHPKVAEQQRRFKATDPFYASAAWRKARTAKLLDSPLCECPDCQRTHEEHAANTVDHIKPRKTHPELELDQDNLRAMSWSHHSRHHARRKRRGGDGPGRK
jgi:5-methylcytosine-specific restriction protein A